TDSVNTKGISADVAQEMGDIAITLVISRFEVIGRVVVKSLAHDTPVVATGAGGIPEVISESTIGVESGNFWQSRPARAAGKSG
ncbi:MAG: glycosyltransferase, partial [Alphaproteobacteria bacterium]